MIKDKNKWLILRNIVILLGEQHHWWQTKILSGGGEEFMNYILPKTKKAATFQLATEISRTFHDNNIGPGNYHLFRLPPKWEENIFAEIKKTESFQKDLNTDHLLKELLTLSENISITSQKGPVLIGSHLELNEDSIFNAFAKHYYEAFTNEYKIFPYLN